MNQQPLKVTYFDFGGRAEITRLTLAFGGVSFDDHRVSDEEFIAMKPALPLGQLPLMQANGTTFCQSMAIARYAGRIAGLYPADAFEALKVDEAVEVMRDAFNKYIEVTWETPDDVEKASKIKAFTEGGLLQIIGFLEKKVQGKFLLGDMASIADMFLFDIYANAIKPVFSDFKMSAFPKVEAVIKNVETNAGIQAYLAKHAV